jgi:cyclopropane-fatty-acyl-phospholipid synthase
VLGVTISPAQFHHARERCRDLPVEIRLQDYRTLAGRFDKIACVGMFEHVGQGNYRRFFAQVAGLLAAEGLLLLRTVGSRVSTRGTDPWVHHYVFPHAAVPSARQLTAALERHWVLEDWHSFGADYERTLRAWWGNVAAAWPSLDPARCDARFYRLWRYYLHAFMGYFRARRGQLWQLVLSRPTRARVWRRPVTVPPLVHATPEDAEPALPLTGSPAMSHPAAAAMLAASPSP